MQFNLEPHPSTPPDASGFQDVGERGPCRRARRCGDDNIWFGIGAPASRFVIPRADGAARAPTSFGRRPASRLFCAGWEARRYREWNFAPSGQWAAYDFTRLREGRQMPKSRRRLTSAWRTIYLVGARRHHRCRRGPNGSWACPRSSRKRTGPNPIGLWPIRRRQAGFPRPRLLRRAPSLAAPHDPFGIDRLLAEPDLRSPLEGKRVALLAHPASVTRTSRTASMPWLRRG